MTAYLFRRSDAFAQLLCAFALALAAAPQALAQLTPNKEDSKLIQPSLDVAVSGQDLFGDLLGVWKCGPYAIAGDRFDITVVETSTYFKDGRYRSTAELTIRLDSGKVVKTRDRSVGSWSLKSDIIEILYDNVEFLSSDDPTYTTQMGQADADAQQKKKNWAKYKVLELNDKLVTLPVASMYKAAEAAVTCVRN